MCLQPRWQNRRRRRSRSPNKPLCVCTSRDKSLSLFRYLAFLPAKGLLFASPKKWWLPLAKVYRFRWRTALFGTIHNVYVTMIFLSNEWTSTCQNMEASYTILATLQSFIIGLGSCSLFDFLRWILFAHLFFYVQIIW
jgi:hypothetical protein